MGGSFDIKTKIFACNGQQVTNGLNQVFRNPGTSEYQQALAAKSLFGDIVQRGLVQDNWKDLLIAYLIAGVDVKKEFPAWCYYLQALGAGAQGQQNIVDIAHARFTALDSNQGMYTHTNGNGGPVKTLPGSGSGPTSQPADIDSPCPP
jgi:hypothetical protein